MIFSQMKLLKSYLPQTLACFLICGVPLGSTYWFVHLMSLKTFDPKSSALSQHLEENTWLFATLNLVEGIPYYTVTPSRVGGENIAGTTTIIQSFPFSGTVNEPLYFNSLTCISEQGRNLSSGQIKKVDWSNCKAALYFPGAATYSSTEITKVDLGISLIGWVAILVGMFIFFNGLLLLALNSFRTCTEMVAKILSYFPPIFSP